MRPGVTFVMDAARNDGECIHMTHQLNKDYTGMTIMQTEALIRDLLDVVTFAKGVEKEGNPPHLHPGREVRG